MSPWPSIGSPSGVITPPTKSSPPRDTRNSAGPLYFLPLFELLEVTQDDRADAVLVEVQRDAEDPTSELEEFLGHHRRQPLDVCDAVTSIHDGAHLFFGGVGGEGAYVLLDRALNVVSRDCQLCHGFSFFLLVDGITSVVVSPAIGPGPRQDAMKASRR